MKSRKVCIKAKSNLASLSRKGQATKHTIVKWSIIRCSNCFLGSDVNLFEGDIDLSPDDVVDNSDAGDVDGQQISVRRKRNAARNRKKLWVTRVIPYVYDSSLPGKTYQTHQTYHTTYCY